MDMSNALRDLIYETAATAGDLATFLAIEYTVYDFERLTWFTGSRIAEYGQSKVKKGNASRASLIQTIPVVVKASRWHSSQTTSNSTVST